MSSIDRITNTIYDLIQMIFFDAFKAKLSNTNLYEAIGILLAVIVIFLGALVVMGWHINEARLIQVLPQFAPMQYNTALCFALSGIGFFFLILQRSLPSLLCGGLIFIIGFSTLAQYIFQMNFGIDNFLMDHTITTKTSHPGRMAPNTALCFLLIGVALMAGRLRIVLVTMSVTVLILASMALMGYFFYTDVLYGWGNLTRMAIHTAVGFLLLGIGFLMTALTRVYREEFKASRYSPTSVFIIVLVLTGYSWYGAEDFVYKRNQEYFENLVSDATSELKNRYSLYEQSLTGGLGLFNASEFVSLNEWRDYVDTLDVRNALPGINGIGYIHNVNAPDLETYLSDMQERGMSGFKNHPETEFRDKFVIQYIEPININEKAVGLDIGFEKNRRMAAERARDTGLPSLTRRIILVQDQEKLPGFLLLLPVYSEPIVAGTVAERREKFDGWVYAPFIGKNFLGDQSQLQRTDQLFFEVHDGDIGDPDNIIFSNVDDQQTILVSYKKYKQNIRLKIAGQTWNIVWRTSESFDPPANNGISLAIAMIGFLLAIFLYFTLKRLVRSNDIISKEVKKQIKEIAKRETELRAANEELEEFAYRTSHDLRAPLVSSIALIDIAQDCIQNDDKEGAVGSLTHAQNSLKKLETLVKDILALTATKNIVEENVLITPSEVIENSLEKFSSMEGFDTLAITKTLKFSGAIMVKRSRFELIIENLISNAIKYRDLTEDQSFITIKTYEFDHEFLFKIEDNGLGIDLKEQGDMFKMFKRFHPKTSFGSGLGLYMVKKSVDILKGRISYETRGTKGSRFIVNIPLEN